MEKGGGEGPHPGGCLGAGAWLGRTRSSPGFRCKHLSSQVCCLPCCGSEGRKYDDVTRMQGAVTRGVTVK